MDKSFAHIFLFYNNIFWTVSLVTDFFKILNLPKSYNINKDVLKQKYYDISRQCHPDSSNKNISSYSNEISFHDINMAYKIINDDYERAKLFTLPSQTISPSFLEECIKLEERIDSGENLKEYLKNKIEECRKNYNNPEYLCKWGYYRRLYDRFLG